MKPPFLRAAVLGIVLAAGPGVGRAQTTQAPGAPQLSGGEAVLDSTLDATGGPAASSAQYTLRPGYVGQLYEISALSAMVQPAVIDETSTSQLTALATLDDASLLRLAPESVTFSILDGPLVSLSESGLATSGRVVGDRSASARVAAFGLQAEVTLNILDSLRDNFGLVAGDGIDDVWQFDFFDLDQNGDLDPFEAAVAAPDANPDSDSADNFTEWATGYDPLDPASVFTFSIRSRSSSVVTMELSKVINGTTYEILASPNLDPPSDSNPRPVVFQLTPTADAENVPATDPAATEPEKFYRVRVQRAP